MNSEMKLLCVQTWFDFGCRAMFAVALIVVVVALLTGSHILQSNDNTPTETQRPTALVTVRWIQRMEKLMYVALFMWGWVIFGFHLQGAGGIDITECEIQLRPWLSSEPACSCMSIDSKLHPGMVGKAKDFDAYWREIDEMVLSILIFRNYPEFHMPPAIQGFPALTGVYLYSLKLQKWSENAALSSKFHASLRHLSMQSVDLSAFDNSSSFSAGLTSSDFPTTLRTVYIVSCNLTELPGDLDQIWPSGINMLFKSNDLVRIPDAPFRMRLLRLSLAQNQIRELPGQLFKLLTLKWLKVAENPLQSFPQQAPTLSSELVQLNFASTNVSSLPEWMLTLRFQSQVAVYGGSTPFCDALLLKTQDAKFRTYCE